MSAGSHAHAIHGCFVLKIADIHDPLQCPKERTRLRQKADANAAMSGGLAEAASRGRCELGFEGIACTLCICISLQLI